MNDKTIDKIIYSIKANNWNNITNYIEKYSLYKIRDKSEYLQSFLSNIAKKIDDDCFEVIYNNIKQCNYSYNQLLVLTNIITYMPDEKKKMCIETYKLDNVCVTEIIKSLGDTEYKKECLKKYKKFRLNNWDKMGIIENINEPEFYMYCIEKKNELKIDKSDLITIIKLLNDEEYIKRIVKNNKFKFEKYQIYTLICEVKDDNFLIDCILNRKKYGLSDIQVFEIILKIKDVDFLKSCIEKRMEFKLSKQQMTQIIIKTKDTKYIKECINDKEKYKFLGMHIFDLLRQINDKNYLKKIIYSNNKFKLEGYMIKAILKYIDDEQFTKSCIINRKKIGLTDYTILSLIELINDTKFSKKCILNNKKIKLDSDSIKTLIASNLEKKEIKKIIFKARPIGLNSNDLKELIEFIKDDEFKKKCILKWKKIGLQSKDIVDLICEIKDQEFKKVCINDYKKIGINNHDYNLLSILFDDSYLNSVEILDNIKIDLPPEMTIGIEIESCGRSKKMIERLRKKFFKDWNVDKDITIEPNSKDECGTEISSPVLKGNNERTTKKIVTVCKILNDIGNYTNKSCGGHIHIGINFLKSTQSLNNLLQLLSNTEEILYIISNKIGDIPRQEVTTYAVPFSLKIKKSLKKYKIKLNDITDIEELKRKLKEVLNKDYKGVTRFRGINYDNITNKDVKKTIEIRMPNGTVDAKTWIQNINLFGNIFKVAQKLAEIQAKEESELTKEEKRKISLFNKLTKSKIKNKEKLLILLELAIENENQSEYLERYEVNSKLLKKKPKFRQKLKVEISRKPVRITKKEKTKNKEKIK